MVLVCGVYFFHCIPTTDHGSEGCHIIIIMLLMSQECIGKTP